MIASAAALGYAYGLCSLSAAPAWVFVRRAGSETKGRGLAEMDDRPPRPRPGPPARCEAAIMGRMARAIWLTTTPGISRRISHVR